MEIYNCKEISVINIENKRKETKEEMLLKAISNLFMENKEKDAFNKQLIKMINDINIRLMEGK